MTVSGVATLMLNKLGKIYHLNCGPEDIADTVILVGDPERVPRLSMHFDNIEYESSNREFVVHTGSKNGKRISVVSTGIGAGSVEIVMNELDAICNIDFATRTVKPEHRSLEIIRLGTCGILTDKVAIENVVVSDYAYGCDSLLYFYPYALSDQEQELAALLRSAMPEQYCQALYVAQADKDLLAKFATIGAHGITMTCPGFYMPQDRLLRGDKLALPVFAAARTVAFAGQQVLNCEMETALIYAFGKYFGHKCISLSLAVAARNADKVSGNQYVAMDNVIARLFAVICQ